MDSKSARRAGSLHSQQEKLGLGVVTEAWLFARAGGKAVVAATTLAYVNRQALDFLVQRRERDHEAFGGFGLIPVGTLEHIHDDAPLDLIHDLKQRRLRVVRGRASAGFTR